MEDYTKPFTLDIIATPLCLMSAVANIMLVILGISGVQLSILLSGVAIVTFIFERFVLWYLPDIMHVILKLVFYICGCLCLYNVLESCLVIMNLQ